jgi:hypothetical protein
MLRSVILEEMKKINEEKKLKSVEDKAKETKELGDAGDYADTLEKHIDMLKALKVKETKLRAGQDVKVTQQQRSAELRNAAQSQLTPNYAEPQDDYVAPEPGKQPSLLDNDVNYQKRLERMEQSKGNGPTIIIGGQGTVVDSNGNVLHSGAPIITQTGPESVLAVIAMVLAAACTLVYSAIRSRTQVALS